jgi:hypothetical protein
VSREIAFDWLEIKINSRFLFKSETKQYLEDEIVIEKELGSLMSKGE